MRLLVVGRSGQIATALATARCATDIDIIAVGRPQLDVLAPGAIDRIIADTKPDVVVNAAAFTAVDKAEAEQDAAFAVNAAGAGHVARACADASLPIVHISTDYVFDGKKQEPYTEDDPALFQEIATQGDAMIMAVGH